MVSLMIWQSLVHVGHLCGIRIVLVPALFPVVLRSQLWPRQEYSHFPYCSEGCEPCVERSSYSVLIYFVGQSKALEKSRIPMSTCFPLSNDCRMSCMVTTVAFRRSNLTWTHGLVMLRRCASLHVSSCVRILCVLVAYMLAILVYYFLQRVYPLSWIYRYSVVLRENMKCYLPFQLIGNWSKLFPMNALSLSVLTT